MTQADSILDCRRAGVLLHITSLPGGLGNGDLGPDAYAFVDFLADCGMTVWQTLPIGPTHGDGSPYQCMSAHAGNPLLISLERLVERGWLPQIPTRLPNETPQQVRTRALFDAYRGFRDGSDHAAQAALGRFRREHASWLDDFALYVALRSKYECKSWQDWPPALRDREAAALAEARFHLGEAVALAEFEQFLFFSQWAELRDYARSKGVLLFGDMPIFVAGDSADVWACRDYFDLLPDGKPRVVAGVPPDYFSAVGQRWGNPHYNWSRMQRDGFRWWVARIGTSLELYDWIRIDHFRGFEAYWEIPAEEKTAINGCWIKAPGLELLKALFDAFPGKGLPLVAENLGIITDEVEALRNEFSIPGMLILHFAFDGGEDNPYLPQNHVENNVVYTGTHDNDTTLSWFESMPVDQKNHVMECLGKPEAAMPWALIGAALDSVARLALLPMQDILELGPGYRMNTPGTVGGGNWRWRFRWEQLTDRRKQKLSEMVERSGRAPNFPAVN